MKTRQILISMIIPLVALTAYNSALSSNKGKPVRGLEDLEQHLAFTCVHETKPPLSPDPQKLYNYARYHDLHNMWNGKPGDLTWQDAAAYYRIAAANGDYKANVRLQYLLRTGRVNAPNAKKETLKLNDLLMNQLPGTAYYHSYLYLKHGYGLIGADELAYLRKAADLGSKVAQNDLGEIFRNIQDPATLKLRLDISEKLFFCASEQGSGGASETLGISLKNDTRYAEAVKVFHQGVKNGNDASARRLSRGFTVGMSESNKIDYLALKPDAERQMRYKTIARYLSDNDYLNPTVPDLDKIVPLPPAKLPPWDGKIEFQRWYEGASPPKPSDELVRRLAAQAGLHWQTGLLLKMKK